MDLLRKMNEIALLSYSLDLVNIPIQIFHLGANGKESQPQDILIPTAKNKGFLVFNLEKVPGLADAFQFNT